MISKLKVLCWAALVAECCLSVACSSDKITHDEVDKLVVRMAEVEIDERYVAEYLAILNDEARESMRNEPGVLAIFPMQLKDRKTSVRILEMYKDEMSYEAHIQSPHFLYYKESTKEMVKGLKLIDHKIVDAGALPSIFKKIK